MILLVDNQDSFTYMLADYLRQFMEVETISYFDLEIEEIKKSNKYTGFVISPGPKSPKDYPILFDLISHFEGKIPILGVCLGFQALGIYYGLELIHADFPIHGKADLVYHNGSGLFQGLESPFQVGRYHSLALKVNPISNFLTNAYTSTQIPMAGSHKALPIFGVQFHPESILTPKGIYIIQNWITFLS